MLASPLARSSAARDRQKAETPIPEYNITLVVNYQAASFTGTEVVAFTNTARESIDAVIFNLYPNLGQEDENKPRLTVSRVRFRERDLAFSLQSRGVVLKVALPGKLATGERAELAIDFAAVIPRVAAEETSLLAHFLEEINDAIGDERADSAAREIFFATDEAVLLGYFFPLLASNVSQDLDRLPAAGVKSAICAEIANYRVRVSVENGITVVGSGEVVDRSVARGEGLGGRQLVEFRAANLRSFALVLGEHLKPMERKTSATTITGFFQPGSEKVGQRILELAARAVDVFSRAFGPYSGPTLKVVELPLPASFSGIDLPGMVVLAHAYFVDFDSPQPHLPSIVRSQADVIKSALEFTLAHEIAHQWWGGIVGSDPQRSPFLDESLAQFSAVYLYESIEGVELAETVIEQQVRGTYFTYRMFGGSDIEVERPLRDLRSRLQYAAITQAKGAFFLLEMRRQMGDEKFFAALRDYINENRYTISSPEKLKSALLAASSDPRLLRASMRRWLEEKHADEDIGNPTTTLLPQGNTGMRKLGRLFVWIGRAAARPF
ncbi:MAG: M1 family aminopeptidase [Acidobacteriota bacterium]